MMAYNLVRLIKINGIRTYLASRARAMIPAASGAEAEVPVWESVHFDFRSVVT